MTRQSRKPRGDWERRGIISLGLIFVGLSFVACDESLGQRARMGGACPPGEICSEQTPRGLVFFGARTFNDAEANERLATALGGTQTMFLRYPEPPYDPFVAGFKAMLVDSRAAAIESSGAASVVLRGVSEGQSLLRLLEPGTNKLLDRYAIKVAPVARVALLPRELREEDADVVRWKVLAGNPALLGVLLFDPNDHQLVDEGLEVRAHAAEVSRHAWDLFQVTVVISGERVLLTMRAGDRSFVSNVEVASSVDAIALRSPAAPEEGRPIEIKRGAPGTQLCFRAASNSTTVVGATWEFRPSETVSIERPEPPSGEELLNTPLWTTPGCVTLSGREVGPATLGVTASSHFEMFKLLVVE
ncbi:hypothetical protein [Polyangium mundeleinium]|uniref:Lipoprotein n=1 Tax=Polyangium mundeleinium TaxID=2995306 RepID=A0ABT5EK48_9BACT|nr:hypothetical protein [Polyangium mundeleinium]MDC0741312.1 hypothetical protein [Polyangium mundeleinium]